MNLALSQQPGALALIGAKHILGGDLLASAYPPGRTGS
jgi:hypothetical protein